MTICIKRLSNGFHVYSDDPEDTDLNHVFEEAAGDSFSETGGEVDCFARLLWHLNDIMGPSSSRYSDKRLKINIVRGDKYEAPDSNIKADAGVHCPFCGSTDSLYFENEKIDEMMVACGNCGGFGPYVWVHNNDLQTAQKEALERWNVRKSPEEVQEEQPIEEKSEEAA